MKAYEDAESVADKVAAAEQIKEALRGIEFAPNDFEDVKDDAWYAPAVDYVEALGLMNGVGNHKFDPNGKMTRGMVVTVLYRMVGEPDVSDVKTPFTDVPEDAYYAPAVAWAYDTGVVNGMNGTTYAPNDPVTREQMAAILMRFNGFDTKVIEETIPDLRKDLAEKFTDAASISNWATLAVEMCAEIGYMNGDAAGTFRPLDTMSRAECAQVLYNVFQVGLKNMFPTSEEAAP